MTVIPCHKEQTLGRCIVDDLYVDSRLGERDQVFDEFRPGEGVRLEAAVLQQLVLGLVDLKK